MKKFLEITLAALAAIFVLASLFLAFLNLGGASRIATRLIEMETGMKADISGLRIVPTLSRPAMTISADSIFLRKDSIDIRIRGINARASIKKDSLSAGCTIERNFLRFGSNRVIFNNFDLSGNYRFKDGGTAGSLNISDGKFISTLFPLRTRIKGISLEKGPDGVYINGICASSGTTDVSIRGAAGDIGGYVRGEKDLEVVLDIQSDNVNVNEILSGIYYGEGDRNDSCAVWREEDESFITDGKYVGYPFIIKEIIPLILPDRVNVSADLNVRKARVSILEMSDFSSHLDMADRTGKASRCSFKSNLGNIGMTMFYSSISRDSLYAGADIRLRDLSARQLVKLLPPIDGITPVLRSFKGKFNCDATVLAEVDTAFIPIARTLKGVVNFKGSGMSITQAGDLRKYTSLLMFRDKNIGTIDDVNLYAIVSDSRIKVFPTLLGVDRYQLAMYGSHSFRNTFDYDISVLESPLPFKFGISLHNEGGPIKGKAKSKVKFKLKDASYRDANIPGHYKEVSDAHRNFSKLIDNVIDEGAVQTQIRSAQIISALPVPGTHSSELPDSAAALIRERLGID